MKQFVRALINPFSQFLFVSSRLQTIFLSLTDFFTNRSYCFLLRKVFFLFFPLSSFFFFNKPRKMNIPKRRHPLLVPFFFDKNCWYDFSQSAKPIMLFARKASENFYWIINFSTELILLEFLTLYSVFIIISSERLSRN